MALVCVVEGGMRAWMIGWVGGSWQGVPVGGRWLGSMAGRTHMYAPLAPHHPNPPFAQPWPRQCFWVPAPCCAAPRRAEQGEEAPGAASAGRHDQHDDDDDAPDAFDPSTGNVVFGSAADGWAFRIDQFAAMYAEKLGAKPEALCTALWGPYAFSPKDKRVVKLKGRDSGKAKPMFVQFALEPIWKAYSVCEGEDVQVGGRGHSGRGRTGGWGVGRHVTSDFPCGKSTICSLVGVSVAGSCCVNKCPASCQSGCQCAAPAA